MSVPSSAPAARDFTNETDLLSPWQRRARCSRADTDLFFPPETESPAERVKRETTAKQICSKCPVRMRCRAEALYTLEAEGIWGGMTERERRYAKRPYGIGKDIAQQVLKRRPIGPK